MYSRMTEITGIDGNFFLWLGTIVFGSVSLMVRYCYKSKSKSVDFCCIRIERDIETELKEDTILRSETS